jgi:hypothetical protein
MVFIRPKILSDGAQTAYETGAKYNFIREVQKKAGMNPGEILPLLPFTKEPVLPPIPPPDPSRPGAPGSEVKPPPSPSDKPPSGPAEEPAPPKQ